MGLTITKLSSGHIEVTGSGQPYSLLPAMHVFRDNSQIDGAVVVSDDKCMFSFRASNVDTLSGGSGVINNPTGDQLYAEFKDEFFSAVSFAFAREFDGASDDITISGTAHDLASKTISFSFVLNDALAVQQVFNINDNTGTNNQLLCTLNNAGASIALSLKIGGGGVFYANSFSANLTLAVNTLYECVATTNASGVPVSLSVNSTPYADGGLRCISNAYVSGEVKLGRTDAGTYLDGVLINLNVDSTLYNEDTSWQGGTITTPIKVKSSDNWATWSPA